MDRYLYDTHFHLDLFDSFNEVVEEIEQNRIYTIAVTNLPVLFTKMKARLASKYIKPALGFHPELLFQYQNNISEMWELLSETRYIGEVGLDFKTGKDFKLLQINFFEELIYRCNLLGNKILTVHSRMGADEIVSIVGHDFNGKIIMHWFSGNRATLKQALDNGFYFSINYSMLTTNSGQDIIKFLPLDRILLESDAPFIKINNQQHRPLNMIEIVTEMSEILRLRDDKMSTILWENFKNLLT